MVTYGQVEPSCQCCLGFGKHKNSSCICVVIIFQFPRILLFMSILVWPAWGWVQPLEKCGYRPWCLLVQKTQTCCLSLTGLLSRHASASLWRCSFQISDLLSFLQPPENLKKELEWKEKWKSTLYSPSSWRDRKGGKDDGVQTSQEWEYRGGKDNHAEVWSSGPLGCALWKGGTFERRRERVLTGWSAKHLPFTLRSLGVSGFLLFSFSQLSDRSTLRKIFKRN